VPPSKEKANLYSAAAPPGVTLTTFGILGFFLGYRPLADVDIGWHLAGGLWMHNTGQLITKDPLGAGERFWWCYSWLVELLFAATYQVGEFNALLFLQGLFVALFCFSSVIFVRAFTPRGMYPELLALGILIVGVSPVLALRPQLLSLIGFMAVLLLVKRQTPPLITLAILTILWANIHVYWCFVPLVVGLRYVLFPSDSAPKKRIIALITTASLASLGLLTPYGSLQLSGLFSYAFSHSVANELILEFAPLSPSLGPYFLFACLTVLLHVALLRQALREKEYFYVVLSVVFLFAGLMRVKFFPLYIISTTPLLIQFSLNRITNSNEALKPAKVTSVVAAAFVVSIFSLSWHQLRSISPVDAKYQELIKITRDLTAQGAVLNRFNDGGWLSLALYLNRPAGSDEALLKPVIDGRTLVQGEEKLRQYRKVHHLQSGWLEVVEAWNPEFAVLERGDPLVLALKDSIDGISTLKESTSWEALQFPQ